MGRAPRTKETLPDFLKWCRVTRRSLVFRGLTGSQRTPGFWGVTQQWLEAILFQLWALSHDGGRRYEIMTTNMSEVFNSVFKGARSLPFIALVQLTFFRLNSYFVARREQGANRLAFDEQFTPYVVARIQGRVVKAGSMEIVLYDHI